MKWNSVKDKWPTKLEKRYLVKVKGSDRLEIDYYGTCENMSPMVPIFHVYDVTHWIKLPKRPRKKKMVKIKSRCRYIPPVTSVRYVPPNTYTIGEDGKLVHTYYM
jgi:hypothetical protein